MKGFLMQRAASALLAMSLAGAAAAQPAAPAAPAQVDGPPRGAFPAVRNEDAAYRAALAQRAQVLNRLGPVSDATLANPPAGDWLHWRRAYDGTGFSPLDQINKRNVAGLTTAWDWSLPVGPNEITPLVYDGVLFIASANRVQAIDGATGDLLWQYTRPLPPALNNGVGAIAKNLAIWEDRLFVPTPDKHMVALELKTGKVIWDHEIAGPDPGAPRVTGGPIVARGKVMIGTTSCNGFKGGCYILAMDARTGAEAWRFYTIARPGEPGGDSWNGHPLEERYGGAVWIAGTYDPELNLLYWGLGQTYNTGTLLQPMPGKTEVSNNDALYTNATVALNPDTGKLVWAYQHAPRDVWDMDWVFERSLTTLSVGGKPRKVAITAGKIAVFDVLDRTNGQYLFSKDLGLQNIYASIDPKTGRKIVAKEFEPQLAESKVVCPHSGGARSWPATAFNPRTKIVYVPLIETCMNFTRKQRTAAEIAAGGNDLGWFVRARPDSDGNIGRIEAINMETGKTVWKIRRRATGSSAMLATAGGLVFEGARDRYFRAFDDATGKVLWQTRLAAEPSSFPIAYAAGGKQYVAVVSGGGGAHDITWPQITPEIDNPTGATTLQVFALPGK